MSKLARFMGQPKEYDILGEKVTLYPLKGKDMHLIMGMKDGEEIEGMQKLLLNYLQQTYGNDVTIDDLSEFSVAAVNRWMECIMDINGVKPDGQDSRPRN